jgi:hypothetical protein
MTDDDRRHNQGSDDAMLDEQGPVELDEPVETMSMTGSFGTAVGAAMLGFEQALRNEPPPEVLAAEHMPERDHTSGDGSVTIGFPAPIERPRD